ncbi:MAG TPA: UDP-N-acetylmuramoyl-L-alanine--D-glutamate ligase [Kiloniellaceae bacterium]|nr:UDP-N-acetylmuramoyl-L-alanine--D-glutamate ligase [Kiloniellaceae bacterium]
MIDLSFFSGLPVAVLGLGKSGMAAARALQAGGGEVWAWDDSEDQRAAARAAEIPLVDLNQVNWQEVTSLILSPGIPHTHPQPHPVVEAARAHNVEIIGDIELLGRAQRNARFLGITGTNGKSTTTALVGHILQLAGRAVAVGGNLGTPALTLEPLDLEGVYVLEMSSYQLELTRSITFDVAVLLNISPDHLERHGGFDGYVAAKRMIFHRQTKPRSAVIGVDDETCSEIYGALKAADEQDVIPISGQRIVPGGVFVEDGVLIDDMDGARVPALDLKEIASLPGTHNWQNAAAAYAACRAIGVDAPVIAACLRSFPGLPHRQEILDVIDGVPFINDSKATNVEAAAMALACYDKIIWIAGGRAKEGGLAGLERYVPRIVHAFLIGEAAEEIAGVLKGQVPTTLSGRLEEAVPAAAAEAARHPGAVVLLSPACASFDQYRNFEIRGDAFRDLVAALPGTRGDRDSLGQVTSGGGVS